MSQLHELIAVESDIKAQAEKILTEANELFSKKGDRFQGGTKTYSPFNAEDRDVPEGTYVKPIVTTVDQKLDYVMPYVSRLMDLLLQKEKTNAVAKADLIVDEITLAKDVPVTTLVQYEKLLVRLRGVVEFIPTLDPALNWTPDTNTAGVYNADKIERTRTRKVQKALVLYQATDKHPAQTQLIVEDAAVGIFTEVLKSGSYSPIQKSKLLAKVDKLIEGVKRARSKANKTDTIDDKVGAVLVKFLRD